MRSSSVSRVLHRISKSDEVWQEFCRWRGTEKSRMYKQFTVLSEEELAERDDRYREECEAYRGVFEAFQDASEETGAYDAYKALHIQGFPDQTDSTSRALNLSMTKTMSQWGHAKSQLNLHVGFRVVTKFSVNNTDYISITRLR